MEQREKIAHHEAAHAVLAIRFGPGLSGGIDLDAPTSVMGAFGHAAVNLFKFDDSLSEIEQQKDLVRNIAIICAGAASDARINGEMPIDALKAQTGDFCTAWDHAISSPLINSEVEVEYVVTEVALDIAMKEIENCEVWDAIERVASATIAAGGRIGKDEIEELVNKSD